MTEGELLLSKIDVDDEQQDDEELNKKKIIKERNDYYHSVISAANPPIALNSMCLRKINSKEVFEKQILNSETHLSTLIPEFKITRDFVFNFLKNYAYFDLTEEESRYLLQKYFSDALTETTIEEEPVDLNDEGVGISESDPESDIEDEETQSKIEEDSLDVADENDYVSEPEEASLDVEQAVPAKLNNEVVPPKDNTEQRFAPSVMNFSSIRSMPTENFCNKKNNILKKHNMTEEKINETKEMKKNISLFLKNALEKRSGIDKKTTIIQFLYKNNFKGKFDSSFFDMKDETGNLIFDYELIDEWYDAIEQIEDKQKATFECSQLIITASLYGIECLAKKIGIKELANISSEVKDPTNLPKNLESTKRSLTNLIDNNIPNCFALDLLFFIGNVYIKNKVGLSPL